MQKSNSVLNSSIQKRLPQFLGLFLWIIQVFLMLNPRSFVLSMGYPLPFKDAYYEDYVLFFIVYSILFLLFYFLSVLKPYLSSIAAMGFLLFEVYIYISPLIFKYINLSYSIFSGYAKSILNPATWRFWSTTGKSFLLLVSLILLFISLLSKRKKSVIILFGISTFLLIGISLYQSFHVLTTPDIDSTGKSIAVCFFRILPFLPLFFTGYQDKE